MEVGGGGGNLSLQKEYRYWGEMESEFVKTHWKRGGQWQSQCAFQESKRGAGSSHKHT